MKEKILDIASQQLLIGGYNKLSFAKIADELKTTKANIHYHFKNKENLALEVFIRFEKEILALYCDFQKQYKYDYIGFFHELEDSIWEPSQSNLKGGKVVIFELISDADLPEQLAELCRKLHEKLRKIVRDVIQDGIDCGQIDKKFDADREALRAFVLTTGMFTNGHYFESSDQFKEQLNGILRDWVISLKAENQTNNADNNLQQYL